jgi:hypothetical protein
MFVVREWTDFVKMVLGAVAWAVERVIVIDESDRKGGYFTLVDYETGGVLIPPTLIGEVINGKGDKYKSYCQEKAGRLLSVAPAMARLIDASLVPLPLPYITDGVWGGLASSELRDELREQWGGAVLTLGISGHPLILSFSGLTEAQDEAAMMIAANKADVVSRRDIRTLASRAKNEIVLRFYQ